MQELKQGIYHPVYFLSGEETYYTDLVSAYIEKNILNDEQKSFNQMVFYGKDSNIGDVINTAKRFPMMGSHQVVILKEAQEIKEIEKLDFYLDQPLPSTVLVINYKYKKPDKRKKFFKELPKKAVFMETKRLYEDKVPAWIESYLKTRKYKLEPGVGKILTDFLGAELGKIAGELDKLMLVMPQGSDTITAELVEKNIGISKDFNNFELQKALGNKEVLKANRIVLYFCKNPKDNPMPITIATLHSFFSKLLMYHYVKNKDNREIASTIKVNPYFVRDYQKAAHYYTPGKIARVISYIRDYDLRSKGVNNHSASDCELLKELVYKILH